MGLRGFEGDANAATLESRLPMGRGGPRARATAALGRPEIAASVARASASSWLTEGVRNEEDR